MRLRRLVLLLSMLCATLIVAPSAYATPRIATPVDLQSAPVDGKRIALVIGNSKYRNTTGWSELENAERDARFVANELAKLPGAASFEVTLLIDQTYDEMQAALADYARRAATADVSVIYYAGHGFQFKSENFLTPVDARPRVSDRSLDGVHVRFADVVKSATAKKLTLFFLDACRTTNAITSTSDIDNNVNQATYFGSVESDNTAVIYAAGAKLPAYDAVPTGTVPERTQTSPFAQAVINQLRVPGLELTKFYKWVRGDVKRATSALSPVQKPIMAAGLDADFFFLPSVIANATTDIDDVAPASASADGGPSSNFPTDVGTLPALTRLQLSDELLAFEDVEFLVQEVLQQRSLKQLGILGSQGDPIANYILGIMYFQGMIVEPDWDQAWDYFDASASTGDRVGLYGLAWFAEALMEYDADAGTETNVDIDLEALYRASHEQGFLPATIRIAEAYSDRLLAPPDDKPTDNIDFWRMAAEANHARSMYELINRGDERADYYKDRLVEQALGPYGSDDQLRWTCMLDDAHLAVEDQVRACVYAARIGDELALQKLTLVLIDRDDVDISRDEAQNLALLTLQIAELSMDDRARVEQIAEGKF